MTRDNKQATIGTGLLILLALITALDAMAIDMYLPGMPDIAEDLGVSAGQIQQTLAIFLIGLAVGQAIYGPLLDRFGRRWPLLIGLLVFIGGSVIAALAHSFETLLAARFLQALGASAGLVAPRAIIDDVYELKESAQKLSILMQVVMVAPIVAPVLGGLVLLYAEWHMIFWAMAALALVTLVWGVVSVPDTLPIEQRVALSGASIVKGYARLFVQPVFMLYSVASGLVLGAFFSYISGSSFVFMEHFGLNSTQYSQLFAANSVGLVVGGAVSNALVKREWSTFRVMMLGTAIYTLAGALLWCVNVLGAPTLVVYGLILGLAIASLGMVFGNVMALIMNAADSPAGVASALMGVLQYLLSAVVGLLVSLTVVSPSQLPATIAICGTLALVLCWCASVKEQNAAHPAGTVEST
ncbi:MULTISPECIES: multidrug effflux MFS transporter [unclassified Halomonas]|uniref:multidrug effflux MFS transporter n=1 Tax=unclassified Halomonas TaxID=2609666 RepID=UPI00209CABFE|nr:MULTISPECIES: multidrug effflux MFS transporter [unclassified Halomonas]MCP1315741.1 multidrug effflux MFS transporter [Halomonas sp. 707D7]MCP1327392.1 multidrug effflux MFS transporter [Halomonas sp. 707D4]